MLFGIHFRRCFWGTAIGVLLAMGSARGADGVEAEVRQALDGLRGMSVPKEPAKIAELNRRMDAAWNLVHQNSPVALPIVEAELKRALAAASKDSFYILDTAHLLLSERGKGADELGVAALEAIDSQAEIVRANWQELFEFAMKVGATGAEPARYVRAVDRLFWTSQQALTMFRAPHYVSLNPDDIAIMVFGVAGDAAAKYLGEQLAARPQDRRRLLQLIEALGTEDQVAEVGAVLASANDYETVVRCVAALMRVGGPAGRAAVQALAPNGMDDKSREYLASIRRELTKVSSRQIARQLDEVAAGRLSDREVQRALDLMEQRNGEDDQTPPAAVLRSGLPTEKLLAQVKRIRARSFRRMTNHVFEDLPITNLLINGLQYRRAEESKSGGK